MAKKDNPAKDKVFFDLIFSEYQKDTFYDTLNLLENEKQKEKFIKTVEKIVRGSIEYRNYIKYLKTEALNVKCTILNKLPEEVTSSISIEMHHFPFTLYDLTEIILNKYLKNGKPFTRLSIANELMDSHYFNQVGIIPLSVTMHQLAHSNPNILSKNNIFGSYSKFIEEYELYLTEEHENKIDKLENLPEQLIVNTISNYLELDERLLIDYDDTDFDKVDLIEVVEELSDDENTISNILSDSKEKSKKKLGKVYSNVIEEIKE